MFPNDVELPIFLFTITANYQLIIFRCLDIQTTIVKHDSLINFGKLSCRFDIKFSFMYVSEVQIKALIADIVQDINGQHN